MLQEEEHKISSSRSTATNQNWSSRQVAAMPLERFKLRINAINVYWNQQSAGTRRNCPKVMDFVNDPQTEELMAMLVDKQPYDLDMLYNCVVIAGLSENMGRVKRYLRLVLERFPCLYDKKCFIDAEPLCKDPDVGSIVTAAYMEIVPDTDSNTMRRV